MPSTRAEPSYGMMPSRLLSSVDLPAPLGPSRPMMRPSTVAVTSAIATIEPYRFVSLVASINGGVSVIVDLAALAQLLDHFDSNRHDAGLDHPEPACGLFGDVDDAPLIPVRAAVVDT